MRFSRPRVFEVEDELRDRRVDLLLHRHQPLVAVLVRVPVEKRDVLGRHLDVARAGLPPGAAPAGSRGRSGRPSAARTRRRTDPAAARNCWPGCVSGHVLLDVLQRLERQIERLRGRRAEQAMRVVVRAQQRLALIGAAVLADRAGLEQPPVEAIAILEAPRRHAARRAHDLGGLVRVRHAERTVLAAEKSRRRERLQLLAFAEVEALADVDEGRHRRDRAARACATRSRPGAGRRPSAAARSRCATDTDGASAG